MERYTNTTVWYDPDIDMYWWENRFLGGEIYAKGAETTYHKAMEVASVIAQSRLRERRLPLQWPAGEAL